jgi:hypothetical protein
MVNEIREYANRLKDAAKWHSSGEAISQIQKDNKKDYVYEIYVYFRVLADLKKNYTLLYCPGANDNHYFPKKAGNKRNFPHFEIYEEGSADPKFQICAGTKVSSPFKSETRAPDISFQKGDASNEPCQEDVLMIFDAKHKLNEDSKLPSDEVDVFIRATQLYKLDEKDLPNILFNELYELKGNCIITNAKAHSVDDAYVKNNKIKEVENFKPGRNFNVKG